MTAKKIKILIVDDIRENLYLLETILKHDGYDVVSAKNGVEALEKLKKDSVDLIVSDILMPKMDGFQLCRECKSDNKLRKIPFIFYTATYTEKKDKEFALNLGAEAFIVKPTKPDVFLKTVEALIDRYKKGSLIAPKKPIKKKSVYLAEYSKRLIKKLGRKMLGLEEEVIKRKKAENALRKAYDGLEIKVKERTVELAKILTEVSREKDKVDAILYSIGDGVFVVDIDYKIILFNRAAANISGFSVKEAIGKKYSKILRFVHVKDKKINDRFVKETVASCQVSKMSNDTSLIRKDCKRIPVANSAAPLKDENGKVIGCVVVFRDITKEREIDRMKTEFVSLASHQLRTPLTTINWFAEMLLAGDVGKVNKAQKNYLEKVYHGSQRMVTLVNAFLNVSRIELGTLAIEPEPTNLVKLAESVLDEFRLQIKDKKIKIEKNYGKRLPSINVDPKLMRIVFQNLLNNAVKYTPSKSEVRLDITKQKQDILIKIADTGYGIPKHQQSKIFTKLFSADNIKEKNTDGTGLGLYVVKAIIDQSGAKIWFESEENKGTTFYVSLPLLGMKAKEGKKGLVYTNNL